MFIEQLTFTSIIKHSSMMFSNAEVIDVQATQTSLTWTPKNVQSNINFPMSVQLPPGPSHCPGPVNQVPDAKIGSINIPKPVECATTDCAHHPNSGVQAGGSPQSEPIFAVITSPKPTSDCLHSNPNQSVILAPQTLPCGKVVYSILPLPPNTVTLAQPVPYPPNPPSWKPPCNSPELNTSLPPPHSRHKLPITGPVFACRTPSAPTTTVHHEFCKPVSVSFAPIPKKKDRDDLLSIHSFGNINQSFVSGHLEPMQHNLNYLHSSYPTTIPFGGASIECCDSKSSIMTGRADVMIQEQCNPVVIRRALGDPDIGTDCGTTHIRTRPPVQASSKMNSMKKALFNEEEDPCNPCNLDYGPGNNRRQLKFPTKDPFSC